MPFANGRMPYASLPPQKWVMPVSKLQTFTPVHRQRIGTRARHLRHPTPVKVAARRAGFGNEVIRGLSGHSMRVGAAQDMMVAGIDTIGIMQAGGWRTHSVLARLRGERGCGTHAGSAVGVPSELNAGQRRILARRLKSHSSVAWPSCLQPCPGSGLRRRAELEIRL